MPAAHRVVTAHQPHFLPWTGYLHRISLADVFVVMDTMEYTHHSYINRNRIVGPAGVQWLSVPVRYRDRSRDTIEKIEISNQRQWRAKHIRTIEHCYRRSPGFDALFPRLEVIYREEETSLLGLDMALLKMLLDSLGVTTEVLLASSCGVEGRKEDELFLSLLRRTGSDTILLGLGASNRYIQPPALTEAGFRIARQRFEHPEYAQGRRPFAAGVSALDMLMRVGVERGRTLMRGAGGYELGMAGGN
jgi:hypothetical protein